MRLVGFCIHSIVILPKVCFAGGAPCSSQCACEGFFIVQKEAGGNFSNSDIAAITEADVEKERQHRKNSLLSQVSEHSSVHSVRSRSRSQDFRSFRKLSTGSATSRHSYRSTPVQAASGHPDYDGLLAARMAAGYQSSLRSYCYIPFSLPFHSWVGI